MMCETKGYNAKVVFQKELILNNDNIRKSYIPSTFVSSFALYSWFFIASSTP